MKVDRIFIAGFSQDLRWTQCCVASIRRWHPSVPIHLIKGLHKGDYDTRELEHYWDVIVSPEFQGVYGWGMAKLEPLMMPTGERILVIDSDILFLGPVLDALEALDEDIVIDGHAQPEENVEKFYFDRKQLKLLDPEFEYPGFVFNGGVVLATAGLLVREDFETLIDFAPPPQVKHPNVFRSGEQGVLNYVVLKQAQLGRLKLGRANLQQWSGCVRPRSLRISDLNQGSPHRHMLHYAGPKQTLFSANRNGHLLRHFEQAYYARLPQGVIRRRRERLERLFGVLTGRLPWTQYA